MHGKIEADREQEVDLPRVLQTQGLAKETSKSWRPLSPVHLTESRQLLQPLHIPRCPSITFIRYLSIPLLGFFDLFTQIRLYYSNPRRASRYASATAFSAPLNPSAISNVVSLLSPFPL